jgi:gas vesicle protein
MSQDPDQIRREIEQTRQGLGETLEDIEDKVSPARIKDRQVDRVRSGLQSVRERVMGSNDDPYSSSGPGVGQRVGDAAGSARDTLAQAPNQAIRQARGNPLAAGLVAFGGGMLLASLLPSTEPEQQAAQALRDRYEEPVKEGLQQVGQEAKERLQGPAQEAAESVKQTAQEGVERTKGDAQSSAQQVQDDAQQARQNIQS